MCGFYCIAFIEYMIAGKTVDYTNCFFLMTIKKMAKENVSLNFRLKKPKKKQTKQEIIFKNK